MISIYGDIIFPINCKQCKAKGEARIWAMTDTVGKVTTILKDEDFELPDGWSSLDWLSKAKGSGLQRLNEHDEGQFCSLECIIKYFQKKRRSIMKPKKTD